MEKIENYERKALDYLPRVIAFRITMEGPKIFKEGVSFGDAKPLIEDLVAKEIKQFECDAHGRVRIEYNRAPPWLPMEEWG